MGFDSQIMLRAASAGDLTATMTGSYVAIPPQTGDSELRISVPDLAETGDKIVATVTMSDDGTNAHDVITMPDITYANVHTAGKTEYFCRIPPNRAYIKLVLTVTDADSGSDFNAGKVLAGIVPAGRHQSW